MADETEVLLHERTIPQQPRSTVYHVHTYEREVAKVRVKVERNSTGYNWEVSAQWDVSPEGETVDLVLALVRETEAKLRAAYGSTQT